MFETLTALLNNNLPFVVFKKPDSREVKLYFQEDDQLHLTQDFSCKLQLPGTIGYFWGKGSHYSGL